MNGKERYLGVLNGQAVDFLPRIPILMQFAAEHIGSNYGEFASDYNTLVKANEACAREFGMDQVSCISDPYRETQGFGSDITYVTDGVPRSTHPLSSDRDLSQLLAPDPLKSERMLDRVNACRLYKETLGDEYSILGWVEGAAAEAADLRDIINFLMDVMDDESYCCELMDLCLKTAIDFAGAQVDAGADTIGIGDAIASQVSVDIYERLILPREEKLVSSIKDTGAFVRLHICGDITHLLPGIAQLDIDIIDVDHMVDPVDVRKALDDRIVIAGNIDPAAAVFNGTPESIRVHMEGIYKNVGNPFMINAGCEIPSGTPAENLQALCKPVDYVG
ncbi:MAG: uroporphyrinogen decarboxylase family protein [Kiritimatiellia bacterium]|jgi:MtaA/CmuA family methyltransferase|nr:uroporphyrinogen decarboxylase family protein [Kiritimatiellia bacterium]MDP6848112.1 uroporphyrinogen decarboxylase family protein [Kiritimatiellia bacterium]